MKCCLSDLRYKEVINMATGQRLLSLIVPGQKKFGGLLMGEDDYVLPWSCITRMGEDIILAEVAETQPRKKREKRPPYV